MTNGVERRPRQQTFSVWCETIGCPKPFVTSFLATRATFRADLGLSEAERGLVGNPTRDHKVLTDHSTFVVFTPSGAFVERIQL